MSLAAGDSVSCAHDPESLGEVLDWLDYHTLIVKWQKMPSSTPWRPWYDAGTVPSDYLVPARAKSLKSLGFYDFS